MVSPLSEKTSYAGWPNCFRLSNGVIDLVATSDVGPRIIRFGLLDQENEFKEFTADLGLTGGGTWRVYGGHRLWHAPEDPQRTYVPDNGPVEVREAGGSLQLVQPTEELTGLQKEMHLQVATESPRVRVTHRLRNNSNSQVETAAWAISVMAPGGAAVIPLPPRVSHEEKLTPASMMTLWSYTNLEDPRWILGRQAIALRQIPGAATPQKIGLAVPSGWAAYLRNGHAFVKSFLFPEGAVFPDFGSNVEVFTNAEMLEFETLGPIVTLQPGQSTDYVEEWSLFETSPDHMGSPEAEFAPIARSLGLI